MKLTDGLSWSSPAADKEVKISKLLTCSAAAIFEADHEKLLMRNQFTSEKISESVRMAVHPKTEQ